MIVIDFCRKSRSRNRTFIAYILDGGAGSTAHNTTYVIFAFYGRAIVDGFGVIGESETTVTIFLHALNATDDSIFRMAYQAAYVTTGTGDFSQVMSFPIYYISSFPDAQGTAIHVAHNTAHVLSTMNGAGIDEIVQDRLFHLICLFCITDEPAGIVFAFYFQSTGHIPHLRIFGISNQSACIVTAQNRCTIRTGNEVHMTNDGPIGITEQTSSGIVIAIIHRQTENIISQAIELTTKCLFCISNRCLVSPSQINGIAQRIVTVQSIVFANLR